MADTLTEDDRSLGDEAVRAADFIRFGVQHASVSKQLPLGETLAYLNIQTLEQKNYCIELTERGYRVVAHAFDKIDASLSESEQVRSETIEELLNQVSPLYMKAFSESLAQKLKSIE